MSKYTKDDIIRMVEEEGIDFIRMQFTDIFGQAKNVAITASQIQKAVNNQISIDGSSIEGFTRIHESDQYLYPDLDTFTVLSWYEQQGKVARLLCDVCNPDGTPFIGDPRGALKRVLRRAADLGYTFNVGPECEFFLFEMDKDGKPTTKTNDEAGYFDLGPIDHGDHTRREICLALEALGFEIEASHHECAAGQHEIDFRYDPALHAADNIMTFKLAVKTIAKRHGMHATFMPKPKSGVSGSGMHINMSLRKDGRNIFADETDRFGLSQDAYYFIGGLMKHVYSMTAITNPLVNSYKRLVSGFEAPLHITWSVTNRSPLIRIPSSFGSGTRIELRSPDSAANPYLTIALCLAAGLDGIKNKITPPENIQKNIFHMTEEEKEQLHIKSLPTNLYDAVCAMERDAFIREILGEHISNVYIGSKKDEWDRYCKTVTEWEVDTYLDKF